MNLIHRSATVIAIVAAGALVGACDRTERKVETTNVPSTTTEHVGRDLDRAGDRIAQGVDNLGDRVARGVENATEGVTNPGPQMGATMNFSDALNNIAEARCDREQRCNNVGQGRRYESSQTCRATVRNDFSRDLNSSECQGGIDRAELSECMSDIRTEDCNNPIDTLSRLAACRTSDLCRATPSPVSMR